MMQAPHRTRPFIPRFRNCCRDSQLQGDREDCLAGGMEDYVTKPIRVDQLVETLNNLEPRHDRSKHATGDAGVRSFRAE